MTQNTPAKIRGWSYEGKFNGWRVLIHRPTLTCFNRHGKLLSIDDAFRPALAKLDNHNLPESFEWLDCEGLERRHKLNQGCLLVLDVVLPDLTYDERRALLEDHFRTFNHIVHPKLKDSVFIPERVPKHEGFDLWLGLQRMNAELGVEFYEGVIAKRHDAKYNIQLVSPEQTTSGFIKHRWNW